MKRVTLSTAAAVGLFVAVLVGAAAVTYGVNSGGKPVTSNEFRQRFDYLSSNGNSNCSRKFMRSIATMSADARLRGSCCSRMDFHRYGEQIEGLKAFAAIDLIPPDPYDIPAPLAARLMGFHDLPLTPEQQAAYDYAMQNSNEGDPCCCQCWRWKVYGGLAKQLIREQGFDGEPIARLWDLSDGCGGASHVH